MTCSSAWAMVALSPNSSASLKSAGSLAAVLVYDQCPGQRADFDQPMPFQIRAGQPRGFQGEDRPDASQ